MAEDILHSRLLDLSSNNFDFDQNIFDQVLFGLNKEVESLSGKLIKDFVFILPLNCNLNATFNAEYIRETNYNHSRLLQIIQAEYRLNYVQKQTFDMILSSVNSNERKIFFRCSWRHGNF